jgi:tRNA threonylcarbamoyladenosine biosynthesis protein TsaE
MSTVVREELVFLPDETATELLATRLAAELRAPATVYLRGDLGVGKTTFTRHFLRARGITGPVKSPTYTLLEPYELADGMAYHFDLYRINDPWELELAGFAEMFDEVCLRLVEWPERGVTELRLRDRVDPADSE